ncbi:MAG: hypothetical protein ABH880_01505 [Patescibacteria group bacterium]
MPDPDEHDEYKVLEDAGFTKDKKKCSKKYQSVSTDVSLLKDVLRVSPDDGSLLNSCGGENPKAHLRKSRMKCKSLGKGESAGFRVFYIQNIETKEVYLLAMVIKAKECEVSFNDLRKILKSVCDKIVVLS